MRINNREQDPVRKNKMFSLLRTLCVGFAVGNSAEQISTVGGYEDPEYVGYGLFVGL
jgi:hypothetical protein